MLFSRTVYQTSSVLHNTALNLLYLHKPGVLKYAQCWTEKDGTLIRLVSYIRKCTLANDWQPC